MDPAVHGSHSGTRTARLRTSASRAPGFTAWPTADVPGHRPVHGCAHDVSHPRERPRAHGCVIGRRAGASNAMRSRRSDLGARMKAGPTASVEFRRQGHGDRPRRAVEGVDGIGEQRTREVMAPDLVALVAQVLAVRADLVATDKTSRAIGKNLISVNARLRRVGRNGRQPWRTNDEGRPRPTHRTAPAPAPPPP